MIGHLGHDEKEKQYHPLSLIEPKYRTHDIRFSIKNKIKMTLEKHDALH